jgi:hypothetical protein
MGAYTVPILLALNLSATVWLAIYFRRQLKKLGARLGNQRGAGKKKKTPGKPTMRGEATVQYAIEFSDGKTFNIHVPAKRSSASSVVIMGPHKSGTVLFNSMVNQLAPAAGLACVDLPSQLFVEGLPITGVTATNGLMDLNGICYLGFRTPTVGKEPLRLPPTGKAAVLLRDPRDILVSLYFSEVKSHTLPESGIIREQMLKRRESMVGEDINDWAIKRAQSQIKGIHGWADWLESQNQDRVKVFRYEQVIFNKLDWLQSLTDWLGWDLDPGLIQSVAASHDIRPESEDASKHIRRVAPGDHKDKLKPETIARVNDIFRDGARRWGYNLDL